MHCPSPVSAHLLLAGLLMLSLTPVLQAQARPTQIQLDNQTEVRVQQALRKPVFARMSILSSVNRGIVTLSGTATSEAAKELASSELANVEGVKTVLNNLTILNAPSVPRPAPQPAALAPANSIKVVTLPSGTLLPIRIADEIDTKTAKANDTFHGTTAAAVNFAGYTLIPTGSTVAGRVVNAKAAGHFSGSAELAIELVSIRLPNAGGPQDASLITEQISNKAAGRGTNTAAKAGGGAGIGAIVGALAGGGAGTGGRPNNTVTRGNLAARFAGSRAENRAKSSDLSQNILQCSSLSIPTSATRVWPISGGASFVAELTNFATNQPL